jgi:hypothetical protein
MHGAGKRAKTAEVASDETVASMVWFVTGKHKELD